MNVGLMMLYGQNITIADGLEIFQPKLSDLVQIGEDIFNRSLNFLTLTKEDFEFHSGKEIGQKSVYSLYKELFKVDESILELVKYAISILTRKEVVYSQSLEMLTIKGEQITLIDDEMFEEIQEVTRIFMNTSQKKKDFNAEGDKAKAIADKINEGRKKISEQSKGEAPTMETLIQSFCVLSGMKVKEVFDMTLYQFNTMLERYLIRESYLVQIKSALAGADVEIEDWMKNIQ